MTKSRAYWPLALLIVVADLATKRLATARLAEHVPHCLVADNVCLTLTYNVGAAFGTRLGDHSRIGFTLLAIVILGVLWRLYREADARDAWLGAALGMVSGGAIGNLIDRLRWSRGVVDFIDVGVGARRFWVFNVADIGVSVGAALLVLLLWRQDGRRARAAATGEASGPPTP